ncbi:class I adenylate-forming enzyme family protein [Actinophytocola sp.]|uniref:class I adenylate-forming enzyme family protein n=1 Tax=Actinophytocola sp. TaxID=1872138 RepID=UPI003899D5BD
MSNNGVELRDLVPARLRREWVARGHCPDRDLFTLFTGRERAHPDRAAVMAPGGTLTYAQLGAAARRLAARLAECGLGPRDVVGVQLAAGAEAVVADLAVAAVGSVALPIPAGRGHKDTLTLLRRSRAAALVTWTAPQAHLPDLRVVLSPADGTDPAGWTPPAVDAEAPARILVTSGSETEPKMIAYSHNAMAGGRGNYVRALYRGPEVLRGLVLVPLSSSYGSLGLVSIVRHGATVQVLDRFDPDVALRALTEWRPTHLFAVPTMLRRMVNRPRPNGEDLSGLRVVVSSSSLLTPAAVAECVARFGRPVVNVYGSADGVNCHTGRRRQGVGLPDPAVAEIRLTEEGEICARGPMTPLCYVNAPELDARYRDAEGWVRSGDRGRLAADGCLHLVDRLKQVVIRGGRNISPAEVELELSTHPAVGDVACVAVADDDLGERLCACVIPRPGVPAPTLAELTAFLEHDRGLERGKLPELLVVLPEFPLGATGKLCRHTLTRLAAERVPST